MRTVAAQAACFASVAAPLAWVLADRVREKRRAFTALAQAAEDPRRVKAAWLQGVAPTSVWLELHGSTPVLVSPPFSQTEAEARLETMGVTITNRIYGAPCEPGHDAAEQEAKGLL